MALKGANSPLYLNLNKMNIINKNNVKAIIFYDFVGKYGDWLFKQPIILSFQKFGCDVFFGSKNKFKSIISQNKNKFLSQKMLAVVLTRQDKISIQETDIFNKHENIIEIKRMSRSKEIVTYWKRGKKSFCQEFEAVHEQERIEKILNFLNLPTIERKIAEPCIKNKEVVINFNVGENINSRIDFNTKEILRTIKYILDKGYKVLLIRSKNNDFNFLQNNIEEKIILQFGKKIKIKKIKTFQDACNIINGCTYYFGADSGMAHYAVNAGKVVFALYSSRYHGTSPLFSTKFSNHLILHGNRYFFGKIIKYLRSIDDGVFSKKSAINIINKFIKGDVNELGLNHNIYDNDRKIKQLILQLIFSKKTIKDRLQIIKKLSTGIFFSDHVWDVKYDEINGMKGQIFIDSMQFAEELEKFLSKNFNKEKRKISIFAKNSSFFYGTALRRGVSDIDFMTICTSLCQKKKKKILQGIKQLLKKSGFSINLPHQMPIIEKISKIKEGGFRPIIKNGKNVFIFDTQQDYQNLEKYKSRIKMKIILGEINANIFSKLANDIKNSKNLGDVFLKEINDLMKYKNKFSAYSQFMRKIEDLLKDVGGIGSKGIVILRISKNSEKQIRDIIKELMKQGIVYFDRNHLYVNWDTRKPQNAWFIPIVIIWENSRPRKSLEISRQAIRSCIYRYDSFKILKKIKHCQISIREAVDLLSSKSHIITSEIFYFLKSNKKRLIKWKLKKSDKILFLKTKNSDCDSLLDKKINLLGLINNQSIKLNESEKCKLSKYNLFVQFFNNSREIDILKTEFFKCKNHIKQSAEDFSMQFINEFNRLLREYYLYNIIAVDDFVTKEKLKELLFNYFVQGKNLMEGPKNQSEKIKAFLDSFEIKEIIDNNEYLEKVIKSMSSIKLKSSRGNFLLLWLLNYAHSNKSRS